MYTCDYCGCLIETWVISSSNKFCSMACSYDFAVGKPIQKRKFVPCKTVSDSKSQTSMPILEDQTKSQDTSRILNLDQLLLRNQKPLPQDSDCSEDKKSEMPVSRRDGQLNKIPFWDSKF